MLNTDLKRLRTLLIRLCESINTMQDHSDVIRENAKLIDQAEPQFASILLKDSDASVKAIKAEKCNAVAIATEIKRLLKNI